MAGDSCGVARQYRKCVWGVITKGSIQTDMLHLSAVPSGNLARSRDRCGCVSPGGAWPSRRDHQVICYPVAAETWGRGL